MKLNKEITVVLSPTEVAEIIKKHIKDIENININSVRFEIEDYYTDYGTNGYPSQRVKCIECKGKLM